MKINTIYTTYQGEVNIGGIGAPVIFIRTQGCHLRCYLKTMGILCDSPETLEASNPDDYKELTADEILKEVQAQSIRYGGIKLVCFTGGDPLYHPKEQILELLHLLGEHSYQISIETSGTLPISSYIGMRGVSFVLDYKLKSAGLKAIFNTKDIHQLSPTDYIKFVINDMDDYDEFFGVISLLKKQTEATIAVGTYWGGKMKYEALIDLLKIDGLLGQVTINFQAHKLLTMYGITEVKDIIIPREL